MLNIAQLRLEEAVTYSKLPGTAVDNNLSSGIKGKCSRLPMRGGGGKKRKNTKKKLTQVYLL